MLTDAQWDTIIQKLRDANLRMLTLGNDAEAARIGDDIMVAWCNTADGREFFSQIRSQFAS